MTIRSHANGNSPSGNGNGPSDPGSPGFDIRPASHWQLCGVTPPFGYIV